MRKNLFLMFIVLFLLSFSAYAQERDFPPQPEQKSNRGIRYDIGLKNLNRLYEEGALTETEYVTLKKELEQDNPVINDNKSN